MRSMQRLVNIEAKTMIDMAAKQIIPAVIRYTTALAASISAVKSVRAAWSRLISARRLELLLESALHLLAVAKQCSCKICPMLLQKLAQHSDGGKEQCSMLAMRWSCQAMAAFRTPVDKLEMLVDKVHVANAELTAI